MERVHEQCDVEAQVRQEGTDQCERQEDWDIGVPAALRSQRYRLPDCHSNKNVVDDVDVEDLARDEKRGASQNRGRHPSDHSLKRHAALVGLEVVHR